jgi:hypothetical protein
MFTPHPDIPPGREGVDTSQAWGNTAVFLLFNEVKDLSRIETEDFSLCSVTRAKNEVGRNHVGQWASTCEAAAPILVLLKRYELRPVGC